LLDIHSGTLSGCRQVEYSDDSKMLFRERKRGEEGEGGERERTRERERESGVVSLLFVPVSC
jgi:hypothetical protein